jgi:hypothetical protein
VFTRDNATGRTRIFVNGKLVATGTTAVWQNSGNALHIGMFNGLHTTGYFSNVRIISGSIPVEYQTASTTVGAELFIPPQSPLAPKPSTTLLINSTNAAIQDNTGRNVLETVGNARVVNGVKKYGAGAMSFDGTGDYLLAPTSSNDLFNFGTGNFTVECWFYANSLSATNYAGLCGCHNGGANEWSVYVRSNGVFLYGANTTLTGGGTISTGTWYHFAAVRNGNTTTMYLDGVSVDSDDVTGDSYTTSALGFRVGDDPAAINPAFNGYIDDLRITKGVARYTEDFPPPSSAYPTR